MKHDKTLKKKIRIMLAKELAEMLLKYPDYDVHVGIQKYISNSREYSYQYIKASNDIIDIDTTNKVILIGDEQ